MILLACQLSRLQPRCPTCYRPRPRPPSSSPPFQSASGVARLSGCCDSTRLLIIRPPTPLHHPSSHRPLHHSSSHTVASSVLPHRCIICIICIIWAQSCLRWQPVALRQFFPQAMAAAKLPPSCRQAAAKSFRAIAVSASSAAARPSGSVAGSRSRWAAWRAPAQPTPCCPPLTHVPGGPFAHSGAPGLPPRPRT